MYEETYMAIPVCSPARLIQITITEDDDQEIEDDELDNGISFTSTDLRSRVEHSSPDLVFEDSSDASGSKEEEEKDLIQLSLPSRGLIISEKQKPAITITSFY